MESHNELEFHQTKVWLRDQLIKKLYNLSKDNTISKLDILHEVPEEKWSGLMDWLTLITNPFTLMSREESIKILESALGRASNICSMIVDYHNLPLLGAFEDVVLSLELSNMAIHCHRSYFNNGWNPVFWNFPGEMSSELWFCLENKKDFDPTSVLKDLMAIVEAFMDCLFECMPMPTMSATTEELLARRQTDQQDVGDDEDVTLFEMSRLSTSMAVSGCSRHDSEPLQESVSAVDDIEEEYVGASNKPYMVIPPERNKEAEYVQSPD